MSKDHEKYMKGPVVKLAKWFSDSRLTPLLIIASLLLGLMAIVMTPREEEPQIKVPMVDVIVPYAGALPKEVEDRVITPAEKLLWGIPDVEYVYSISRPGNSLITVRFKVGTELEPAVLRVHHKLREYMPEKPAGVGQPLVRSYTIDDVPFLALAFHSQAASHFKLRQISQIFARALSEIPDISHIKTIGGQPRQVRILPDIAKLKKYRLSILELFEPLTLGNVEGRVGVTTDTVPEKVVRLGAFFESKEEIENVVIAIKGGRAIRVKDVAHVEDGAAERQDAVFFSDKESLQKAVTLSFTKRPGVNATALTDRILAKVKRLAGSHLIGDLSDIHYTVTRNYGATAKEKSNELIWHLIIASVSVVTLIAFFLGIRFGLIVGIAVPVTLALTLFIYYIFGYTLNRVTLFALIFSIGILVDDAIVIVENIHRHLHHEPHAERSIKDIIAIAVGEVGNPTILATITVIAAILPMAFVRGLMGPYMSPIPIGASVAMLFSLVIAFTISPWGAFKVSKNRVPRQEGVSESSHELSFLDRIYSRIMTGLISNKMYQFVFSFIVVSMFVGIAWMMMDKVVRVKMLPFDNKSELQIVIDMDDGAPLDQTVEVSQAIGDYLNTIDVVDNYQIYAGTSAPINFNGLVRHYFMRSSPHLGDIQVNLVDKSKRDLQSHDIAKSLRPEIKRIASTYNARIKVVEIPPGPPVLSTIVAEVYGPNYELQLDAAKTVQDIMRTTPGVVDVDMMSDRSQHSFYLEVDRYVASLKRVPIRHIYDTVYTAMSGKDIGLLHFQDDLEPVRIGIRLPIHARQDVTNLLTLTVPANDNSFIPLSELVNVVPRHEAKSIYHKNLKRVVYVVGDLAGEDESPIYALQEMNKRLDNAIMPDGAQIVRYSIYQPELTDSLAMKWDGEWHISYEVFRDLGLAFAVVMILIYILVVSWFESYIVPLVIMIPIPLSLIGIIPGHFAFGAFFTATSMIGFIAGAGIIVRNSIILVDFIELRIKQGMPVEEAVVNAGVVRFRPMLLTAVTVIVGCMTMLLDPIFQGLAISLMTGEVAATLLSRFAVPMLYAKFIGKRRQKQLMEL